MESAYFFAGWWLSKRENWNKQMFLPGDDFQKVHSRKTCAQKTILSPTSRAEVPDSCPDFRDKILACPDFPDQN